MAHKIVDADKLDADLTSIADTIRERSGFSGALGFPDGFKAGVDNVYSFANDSGYTTGVSVGYDEGYSIGYHEGDQNGYSKGVTDGDASGYERGYNAGYKAGEGSITAEIRNNILYISKGDNA